MTWATEPFWWPFGFILLAGSLPTMIWRWLAVALAADIDENSEMLLLVRCISTALVAAVMAQFIFLPTGALSDMPTLYRLAALLCGFAAFLFSRSLLAGIVAGELLVILWFTLP